MKGFLTERRRSESYSITRIVPHTMLYMLALLETSFPSNHSRRLFAKNITAQHISPCPIRLGVVEIQSAMNLIRVRIWVFDATTNLCFPLYAKNRAFLVIVLVLRK